MIAIYLRVSTDKQTLDSQQHAIDKWLNSNNVAISDVITFSDFAISGTTDNREGFQAMVLSIKLNEITKVVTCELSRLSRDFMSHMQFLQLCADHGVEIEVPGKGVIPFDKPSDMLMASIEAFKAADFSRDHSERVKRGIAAAKAKGTVFGAPKGHRRNIRPESKRKPTYSQDLINKAHTLRSKGMLLREISDVLDVSKTMVTNMLKKRWVA